MKRVTRAVVDIATYTTLAVLESLVGWVMLRGDPSAQVLCVAAVVILNGFVLVILQVWPESLELGKRWRSQFIFLLAWVVLTSLVTPVYWKWLLLLISGNSERAKIVLQSTPHANPFTFGGLAGIYAFLVEFVRARLLQRRGGSGSIGHP